MKKRLFAATLCGTLLSAPTLGQPISYFYDSGGNRILKKVVILSANAKAAGAFIDDDDDDEEYVTQVEAVSTDNNDISIKADCDKVTVTVSETEWQGSATVSVHDASGRQVLTTQSNTKETVINLNDQSAGVYLLTVKTGRRTRTWRIGIQ